MSSAQQSQNQLELKQQQRRTRELQLESACHELGCDLARISEALLRSGDTSTGHLSDDSDTSSAVSSARSSLAEAPDADELLAQSGSSATLAPSPNLNLETTSTTTTTTTTDHDDETHNTTADAQAAMPRRSRSLVDDARLDTQRNRQLLDEIRREQQQQQARASMETPGEEEEEEEEERALPSGERERDKRQVAGDAAEAAARPTGRDKGVLVAAKSESERAAELEMEDEDEARAAQRYMIDFPRHISDLDHCNHLLIKYEPELDPTHPGFHDLEYRARRKEVAEVAFNYRHGERIPEIAYSDKERQTWRQIYVKLKEAYAKYACEQHNQAIRQLEAESIYSPDHIPQLQQVSEFLERRTGWRLRPVAGLLSARDFLASLAFRVFQTTQYIRHWGNPEHSVEPDCIHELMGHIPMLCDPEFAQFSQELGIASLGAADEQIERFATLYWFTVEFGLCRETGQLKCYGAGLLSSYGEMEHALESGKPKLKEFIPEETALEVYDDSEYQVVYYVAQSFNDAKAKMRDYAANNLRRRHELAYDPYTGTIRELATYEQLERYTNTIRSDLNRLGGAISRLKMAS